MQSLKVLRAKWPNLLKNQPIEPQKITHTYIYIDTCTHTPFVTKGAH